LELGLALLFNKKEKIELNGQQNIAWINYPKRFPEEGVPASFALLPTSFGAGFPLDVFAFALEMLCSSHIRHNKL
jgi:hypothetical protein